MGILRVKEEFSLICVEIVQKWAPKGSINKETVALGLREGKCVFSLNGRQTDMAKGTQLADPFSES